MSGDCMGEGVWVMQKRKHEPQMPGSRRYMLREPDPKSRFAAFLDASGLCWKPDWDVVRRNMIDFYATNAPATEEDVKAFAQAYDKMLERWGKRRRGSPGNNEALQFAVFIAVEAERRLSALPGSVSVRSDVATALGLVPDTVGKTWKAGRALKAKIEAARAAEIVPGEAHLAFLLFCEVGRRVVQVYPEFRMRYRRMN